MVSVPDTAGPNLTPGAASILQLAEGFLLQAPIPLGSRALSDPGQGRWGEPGDDDAP